MRTRAPGISRFAASTFALVAAMHFLVALDLVFQFLPGTPEIRALWSVSPWVKALWVGLFPLGLVTAILLYRRARTGFVLSLVFCACLYLASIALWQRLYGGFWIAVGASACAAIGALLDMRSNNSSKPKPLRGSA